MQRRTKQLLGLFGLVPAAALVIAGAMPASEAAASEANVMLQVTVGSAGDFPQVEFKTLENRDVVAQKSFDVEIAYTKANTLKVYLTNNGVNNVGGTAGSEVELSTAGCDIQYSETQRTCTVRYNLDADIAADKLVWNYMTRAVVTNNISQAEDNVSFTYQSAVVEYDYKTDGNGNPLAEVYVNSNVDRFVLNAHMNGGNNVFGNGIEVVRNEDGTFSTTDGSAVVFKTTELADGVILVEVSLPFKAYNAAYGKYNVTMTAYSGGVQVASDTAKTQVTYASSGGGGHRPSNPSKPGDPSNPDDPNNPNNPNDPNNPNGPSGSDNPNVPGTGLNLFKDLNISQVDYLVTGLVAFGMVTAFAIFLIVRRNKR